ncbi:tRNA (N6-isopentenyl adenosine(37)-C2)-methylthiotransferase MiaB, partial [Mycolicibacterium setense]|nr:tRNA (N6-isopentenyl adenosine(37)-C2)-methylthiotransferase MiaB [Mycolicibacterium setense]
VALQERISLEGNRSLVGTRQELLVVAGEGRKNATTARISGRARDGRLVHFRPDSADGSVRPGDLVDVEITDAAPHHLIADGPLLQQRRTPAGDASERGQTPTTRGVGLGVSRITVAQAQIPSSGTHPDTACR